MTVTLELDPEIEQELATQARERGVSLETYVHELVNRQVQFGEVPPVSQGRVLELPILHLGDVGSLHRRDIYDDVDRAGRR